MCTKSRMVIVVLLLVFITPYSAFGSFMSWRPFIVRADLAPVKSVRTTIRPPALVFEKFTSDNQDPLHAVHGEGKGKERKWGEVQFGSFRLRISRFQDLQLKRDMARSSNTVSIWETIKLLPARLGDSSSRENLETMGRIFTPQLDLGIEF